MKIIAVEEHFGTSEYYRYSRPMMFEPIRENPDNIRKQVDIGQGRLREMDEAGINMQVLSLGMPGVEVFDTSDGIIWAKKTNDELAKLIKEQPDRFAGVAALPAQDPVAAADELERAVSKLGLKGAQINSHVRGEYLDDRKFWIIFQKAEKLEVPVYIHPKDPSPDMVKPYKAYPGLELALLGFGAEVHLHVLRLIFSGLFDEFPRLKIVIGHMGEALPYWLWRIDNHFNRTNMVQKLKRKPSEYFKDNFFITTSGMFWQPALLCAYLTLGADNILFAVDYPYESNEIAVQFIKAAPICDSDKEKICHLNAERLYKL
jgi:2,3-dihydroxybenzoate decarboxylase